MKVKVVKGFESGDYGNREKGDEFDYPVTEDPGRLVAAGFVERVASPPPKKSDLDK